VAQAAQIAVELRARGWTVVNESPLAVLAVVPPTGKAAAGVVVQQVLKSGQAWVSLARYEERDIIRICVTHGETSDADLSILIAALETAAA